MKTYKVWRAVLLSPFVVPMLLAVIVIFDAPEAVGIAVLFFVFGSLYTIPCVLLVGLPLFRLLEHFDHLSLAALGAVGFVAGLLSFSLIGFPFEYSSFKSAGEVILWGGLPGMVTALAFGGFAGVGLQSER